MKPLTPAEERVFERLQLNLESRTLPSSYPGYTGARFIGATIVAVGKGVISAILAAKGEDPE